MGTPNSDTALTSLTDFFVDGTPMNIDRLVALGLDMQLFAARFTALKPQLPYIEGYEPIENIEFNGPWRNKFWKGEVSRSGLIGTRVLYFNVDTGQSIFSLHPIGSGQYLDLDVFLTRKGEWIIFCKAGVNNVSGGEFRTADVKNVVQTIQSFQSDSHEIRSTDYRELEYWPRESQRMNHGRNETVSVALILMAQLGVILDRSISVKETRLVRQQRLRHSFAEVDARNNLNMTPQR